MLDIADEDLSRFEVSLELYVQYLLRKALSSSITPRALAALHSRPTRCHIIVDYKQKWLPVKHLETQSDSFGKRGKSIWGGCAMRWDAKTKDYKVLNVRIACDDSKQNWYHSLACLRTNLEIVKQHWPDIDEASLQSDGAGNYSCTAFMTSLSRVGEVARVRISDHAITEVGDGKNLVDTDFQQVTMSLNQRKDGGANVETAQQIIDNLDANPTAGTANAGIELGTRAEGKAPKPYTGIDGIYWRVFMYDASGRCTGVRLHQFYGLGVGRVVPIGALRALWKEGDQLDAGAISMTRLQPSAGEHRAITSKRKRSEEQAVSAKAEKVARRNEREAMKMVKLLDELRAERRREQERTTYACVHAAAGCPRRFLSMAGAWKHSNGTATLLGCKWGPKAQKVQPATLARVCLRVRVRRRPPPCHRHRLSSEVDALTFSKMTVKRPLLGRVYGMPKYRIMPLGTGLASAAEVRAAGNVQPQGASTSASLSIEQGGTTVRLTLSIIGSMRRMAPEPLAKGWAIKPPTVRTHYTDEQKALLLECFDNPTRPNEANAHLLFKQLFKDRDGKFARSLVMSAAKIKA